MTFKVGFVVAAVLSLAVAPVASANGFYQNGNSGNQLAGGAVGALAGGLIGSRVAGRGDRTEGAVIGAILGGVAGAAVSGNSRSNNVRYAGSNYYGGGSYYGGGYYNGGGGYYNSYPVRYSTPYYSPYYSNGYYGGGFNSVNINLGFGNRGFCLLYTSPSPRDRQKSRMPSSA